MNPVQYFTDEYLSRCKNLSAEQIVQFLEDFRVIHSDRPKSETRLISIKVEKDLLNAFKTRASLDGVAYQTRIKRLMRESLSKNEAGTKGSV